MMFVLPRVSISGMSPRLELAKFDFFLFFFFGLDISRWNGNVSMVMASAIVVFSTPTSHPHLRTHPGAVDVGHCERHYERIAHPIFLDLDPLHLGIRRSYLI